MSLVVQKHNLYPRGRVLVLEDTQDRLDWLNDVLKNHDVEIVWCTKVMNFLQVSKERFDLIILDHDLGERGPGDGEGLTGKQAAERMDVDRHIPVVVWSVNDIGAKEMVTILKERNYMAAWVPFMFPTIKLLGDALQGFFTVR